MDFIFTLLNFLLALAIYTWLATSIFWGIATYAFASWANLHPKAMWAAIGGAVPMVGMIAALIAYAVKRSNENQANGSSTESNNWSSTGESW
jgi:hypothetical protein